MIILYLWSISNLIFVGKGLSMLFMNIQLTQHHLLKRLFLYNTTSVTFLPPNMNIELLCMHPQSYPTLYDPMNCNPPGSSLHGIFQAKTVDWVAIFLSRGSSWPRDGTHVSCVSYLGGCILYHWVNWDFNEHTNVHLRTLCCVSLICISLLAPIFL